MGFLCDSRRLTRFGSWFVPKILFISYLTIEILQILPAVAVLLFRFVQARNSILYLLHEIQDLPTIFRLKTVTEHYPSIVILYLVYTKEVLMFCLYFKVIISSFGVHTAL